MSRKTPGEVRARTCGTKSPSRSEALRFIDSSKSPSTKIDGSLVNFRRRLSNRHGRPRRMLVWTFEGNTDQLSYPGQPSYSHVQVVVGEASPGLGLVVVVALSLMSTSLQRNVSCSSSVSRAYASFLTTRTETQRAGAVVRLKEQQSNLFPIMVRRDPRKPQNSFDQSWADTVTVLSSVQEDVMRPWQRHFACMSLT